MRLLPLLILLILLLLLLPLSACSGTQAQFDGQVCGQETHFTITDRKDRGVFDLEATCPQGGSVRISTSDSSTSSVIAAQADALAKSAAALGSLVGAVK